MSAATEATEHLGETCGAKNHDHDLIHELSKRLDALWRYNQYIANAEGKPEVQALWNELKGQEQANVDRLKRLVGQEINNRCF